MEVAYRNRNFSKATQVFTSRRILGSSWTTLCIPRNSLPYGTACACAVPQRGYSPRASPRGFTAAKHRVALSVSVEAMHRALKQAFPRQRGIARTREFVGRMQTFDDDRQLSPLRRAHRSSIQRRSQEHNESVDRNLQLCISGVENSLELQNRGLQTAINVLLLITTDPQENKGLAYWKPEIRETGKGSGYRQARERKYSRSLRKSPNLSVYALVRQHASLYPGEGQKNKKCPSTVNDIYIPTLRRLPACFDQPPAIGFSLTPYTPML